MADVGMPRLLFSALENIHKTSNVSLWFILAFFSLQIMAHIEGIVLDVIALILQQNLIGMAQRSSERHS